MRDSTKPHLKSTLPPSVLVQIENSLKHLYISPISRCNLNCKLCYTAKRRSILSSDEILDFINRYQAHHLLDSVTFCGGEVFLLKDFCDLVNQLTEQSLFIQIITNGTINRLSQLQPPNEINLIVSLDGLPTQHDANRGEGRFQQTLDFCQQVIGLGFHLEIFTVVSQFNYSDLDQFEQFLTTQLGFLAPITYHPRKPHAYLATHPVDNRDQADNRFGFLSQSQIKYLQQTKNLFPPQDLGCYQLSVNSDGQIYGCCEGVRPVGKITDPVEQIISQYRDRIRIPKQCPAKKCLGCAEPDFICGLYSNFNCKSAKSNHSRT